MGKNFYDIDLLFAGFLVDDATFDHAMVGDQHPQHAAHRFQKTIISMLSHIEWRSINILGSIPSSLYPKNPKIFFKSKVWKNNQVNGYVVPVINIFIIRWLFRLISFFLFLMKWLFLQDKNFNSNKLIFLYALHTPHLLPIYLVKKLFGVKVIAFVPDLPVYMNIGIKLPFFKRWLKVVDSYFLLRMLNRIDGRILITENMFFCIKKDNSMVIDSISAGSKNIAESKITLPVGKNIIYAGGLEDSYGIKDMVDCFSNSKIVSAGVNLVICGGGSLSKWCSEIASNCPNIFYLGVINNDDVVSLQRKSFALINLRRDTGEYTKYSFPSKIAEYLQAGVPVITTRLAGLPEDLVKYLNIVDTDPVKTVLDVVNDYSAALSKAQNGTLYYSISRSPEEQAKRFSLFIQDLF